MFLIKLTLTLLLSLYIRFNTTLIFIRDALLQNISTGAIFLNLLSVVFPEFYLFPYFLPLPVSLHLIYSVYLSYKYFV